MPLRSLGCCHGGAVLFLAHVDVGENHNSATSDTSGGSCPLPPWSRVCGVAEDNPSFAALF